VATRPFTDTEIAEYAGQLFFRLWRASHTRMAATLDSIGLTPALFGILNVLGARDGVIQQEIGQAMGIDPSTLVKLIDQLEGASLVKRRTPPTDRRAREIAITPKGRRVLGRARQMATEVEDEVLLGLTAAERRELLTLMRRALGSAPEQSPWRAEEGD
jgi:DNA-binding MarR family transcriptional regulator